jgi:tRNA nucleotidyltransferase (CCA-adding enzyme)
MQPKDVTALKKQFPRQGFIKQTESLEDRTKKFQAEFLAKENSAPSAAWKLLHATEPEVVLSLYVSSKSAPVQNRFKAFLTEWPTAKQRIPYVMFGEMRITQDLPIYKELLDKLFFELMDNKLSTPEEMKAFLEPYSPPAPPPPLVLRRARVKKETKAGRGRAKKEAVAKPEPMSLPNEVKDVPVGATPSAAANKVVAKPAPASAAKAAKLPEKKAAVPAKSVAPPAKKAAPLVKAVAKKAVKKAAPAKVVKKVATKAAPVKKAPAKKPVKKQAPAKKVVKKDAKGKRR